MTKDEPYGIVYRVTCVDNGKVYIGVTRNGLARRRYEHEHSTKGKTYAFHNAIKKHGTDHFNWEIIDTATSDAELSHLEKKYIRAHRTTNKSFGYNLSEGGVNPVLKGERNGMYGKTHTQEVKQRLSENAKDKTWEARFGEERAKQIKTKLSKSHKGRKNSPETLKKMSENSYWKDNGDKIKGENNPNYGHRWTDEMKAKSSGKNNPMYGKGLKGEMNGMYGKTLSKSHREKLSKIFSGAGNPNYKPVSNEILDMIINLFALGRSMKYIAEVTKVNANKVKRELIIHQIVI